MNIAQSSPLYEYWNSDQVENDENKRLLKLNSKEPASTFLGMNLTNGRISIKAFLKTLSVEMIHQ